MVARKRKFRGLALSPGLAFGHVCIFGPIGRVPKRKIRIKEVDSELDRLHYVLEMTKRQITEIRTSVTKDLGTAEGAIFDVQFLLTEDPYLQSQLQHKIVVERKNLEWAISEVIEESVQLLGSVNDSYMRERVHDIRDVGNRLIENLLGQQRQCFLDDTLDMIIAAENLVPSQTVQLPKARVRGFVTEHGGATSHAAILARSLGVPLVSGLEGILQQLSLGTTLIVDGFRGEVILSPSKEQIAAFNRRHSEWLQREKVAVELAALEAKTRDGKAVQLMVNIGSPDDVQNAVDVGANGIGLYRTELYFIDRNRFASEEEQFADYRLIAQQFGQREVTIRTLDLGGDKFFGSAVQVTPEANPYLGRRAIRISLEEIEVFKTQLKAILRASHYGNVRIMFPMISSLEEILQIKRVLRTVKKELAESGYDFNPKIPVGIMIEIPSAALVIDSLLSVVDFCSVGTNDLIQYTLAVDRSNERVSKFYEPLNPAILSLLETVTKAAQKANKKTSICGEMAGDPLYTELFIGMGYETLSMSSHFLPIVKKRVREIAFTEAKAVASQCLGFHRVSRTRRFLEERLDQYLA